MDINHPHQIVNPTTGSCTTQPDFERVIESDEECLGVIDKLLLLDINVEERELLQQCRDTILAEEGENTISMKGLFELLNAGLDHKDHRFEFFAIATYIVGIIDPNIDLTEEVLKFATEMYEPTVNLGLKFVKTS